MLGFFKSWLNAKQAKYDAVAAQSAHVQSLIEMASDIKDQWDLVVEKNFSQDFVKTADVGEETSNVVNTLNRNEGSGWEIIGSAYKGHLAQDQQIMIAQARRAFRFDQNAQASILGVLEYLMGKGVTITPKSKDPKIWKLWREFWTSERNKMGVRQFEMIKMWLRDGELFLRYFNTDETKAKTWKTTIRFMDPIDIRRAAVEKDALNTDKMSQGITFDPDDAEKPVMYYMRDRIDLNKVHEIKAAEVQHVKFPLADMDQSRGETALQGAMRLFTQYRQWLDNRIILNKLRTAIWAVREITKDSGSQVSTLSQALPSSARTGGTGDNKKQNIRPGTIYTPPPGVTMRMESANINASDVKEDGRNIILGMSAAMGLPEYMYGDASNANFSSTMMSESPFVKRIHFFQSYLEEMLWKPMYKKVIESAVDAGKLQAPAEEDIFADDQAKDVSEGQAPEDVQKPGDQSGDNEVDSNLDKEAGSLDDKPIMESETELFYGCDIQWPEVIHRDPKEQTEALALARDSGWVSDKTCSETLGFEYAEEVRKQTMIEKDAEANGNSLLGRSKGDLGVQAEEKAGMDQMNKEAKNHFDSLSPADQKSIKDLKDPEAIAAEVKKRMNGKAKAGAGEEK